MLNSLQSFGQEVLDWLLTHGLTILLTAVVAFLVAFLLRRLTRQLETWLATRDEDPIRAGERKQRARTIRRILDGTILFLVVIIGGTMILLELGVEVAPLLAGAGVVGIAISLGAQSLVKDILAGLFVLVEDQFAIGDRVSVAGVSGVVERMTLRATTLRDLDGTVHVIPNGEMRVVSNKTKGWSRVLLRIGVAYDTDLDQAMEVLRQLGRDLFADPAWKDHLLEEPTVAGVDDLRASDVALLFTAKTPPGDQLAVARELRKRIVETLTREGIDMPYPTQVSLTRMI